MILGGIYRCEVENNLDITSADSATITSVTGNHSTLRTNDDVVGFDSRHKNIDYFPQGLEKFFGNLKSIVIYYGHIKEIHQSDLKPYPKLVNLYLENNDIETIEAGLFDFNPKLEGVSFWENKITKIDPNVFDHLSKLQNIWLGGNVCINLDSEGSVDGAKNVTEQGKILCSEKAPELDTKQCIDRCEFQQDITELLAFGFRSVTASVDEKINAVETRLVEKMEEILDKKLKKIFNTLNIVD